MELTAPPSAPETPAAPHEARLPAPPAGSVRAMLQSPQVQKRFEQVMGDPQRAAQFVASLASLVYASPRLRDCDPPTVIAAALQAAALDLMIDANLGQAHIVPYGRAARFQPGWRGYVQLALRSGQYLALSVDHVLEGEIEIVNRFTGELRFRPATGDKPVGVLAYLKLVSGFEKYVYWPLEKIHAHAARYSKTYAKADSAWKTSAGAMELKTVLLDLLRKWGVLSIQLRQAIAADRPPDDEAPLDAESDREATLPGEPYASHAAADQAIAAEQRRRDKSALGWGDDA